MHFLRCEDLPASFPLTTTPARALSRCSSPASPRSTPAPQKSRDDASASLKRRPVGLKWARGEYFSRNSKLWITHLRINRLIKLSKHCRYVLEEKIVRHVQKYTDYSPYCTYQKRESYSPILSSLSISSHLLSLKLPPSSPESCQSELVTAIRKKRKTAANPTVIITHKGATFTFQLGEKRAKTFPIRSLHLPTSNSRGRHKIPYYFSCHYFER